MAIRNFLMKLFKHKWVQFHVMKVGYDINSFKSMFKFIPEKHQETYGEFVAEEKSCKCKVEKYNAKVTEYNV